MELKEGNYAADGGSLHYFYRVVGGTTPVILIHGIGVSSRYMLPLARELALSHTVYAIDLPGFGKSSNLRTPATLDGLANVVADFIEGNSLKNPVLVGNSFGCQVSLRLIKRKEGFISKAVLIGPTMNIFERSAAHQMMRWLQNLKYEPTRAMSWILLKDIWECGLIRVFRALKMGLDDRPEEGLEETRTPILFMRGSLDPISPSTWLEFLAQKNPAFGVAELSGAGHALNFNSPLPLAKIINDFL